MTAPRSSFPLPCWLSDIQQHPTPNKEQPTPNGSPIRPPRQRPSSFPLPCWLLDIPSPLLIVSLSLSLFLCLSPARAAPAAPDIILVVIDSLRADALSCYGQPLPVTPVIDAFAASAVRFEHAFAAAPWTQPSVMSLFASVDPDRHGLAHPHASHATNITTLAECLQRAGYQTVGITANPMAHKRHGFGRGFETYDDFTVSMDPGGGLTGTDATSASQVGADATVTRLAQGWLRRRDPQRPLFLFLFYMDPHWDYLPPPPFDKLFTDDPLPPPRRISNLGRSAVLPAVRARARAAYLGEVCSTDACFGRLLAAVADSPRAAETTIALCADHGEAFWERGLTGHGNNLHDEELHVPLIVRPSGPLVAGAVVTGQVSLIDLAPTLLDLAGVPLPPAWEGTSLRPLFTGGAAPWHPITLDNRRRNVWVRGVRTPAFKLIARHPFAEPYEVYDLAADPGEKNNLVGTRLPSGAAALVGLLRPPGGADARPHPVPDKTTLDRIRSLGYAH